MGRTPCCDEVGLKKGPWTPEEDRILITYVQRHGHENWRALPKQAGLLRCGKSCRLRWMNYLRPDIKRGNFSRDEEDTIIDLHEKLGNRWSAIAERLPGRTDNEIKNVWHTHLKKRLIKKELLATPRSKGRAVLSKSKSASASHPDSNFPGKLSPQPSFTSTEFTSVTDQNSSTSMKNMIKSEHMDSLESFPEIDESFWSDSLSSDSSSVPPPVVATAANESQLQFPFSPADNLEVACRTGEGMEFWFDVFMTAGGLQGL